MQVDPNPCEMQEVRVGILRSCIALRAQDYDIANSMTPLMSVPGTR
jgi:hypothetical protein